MPTITLATALALCAAGPALLRYGWQRNRPAVVAAWAGLALAAALLLRGEGARGLAAGATCAMVSAMVMLAVAAAVTPGVAAPPRRAGSARVAVSGSSSDLSSRGDLARRLGIFLVVVLLDLAASALLAWSVQRGLFHAGTGAADATAFALFLLPLLWLAMASWQMMLDRSTAMMGAMMAAPMSVALLGGLLWLAT